MIRRNYLVLCVLLLLLTGVGLSPAGWSSSVEANSTANQLATQAIDEVKEHPQTALNEGWAYLWGDSPFSAAGVPEWTLDASALDWQPIAYPADPAARNGQNNIWFRVTLPETSLRDPVLYASSIDFLVEAYVDGQLIYRHGKFDKQGMGKFAGWPWHMITLPEDFAGKTIYFRVFSDYKNIGFWGEIKVAERVTILDQVVEESAQGLLVSGITMLIALMAGAFAILQGQRRRFLCVCLFSLAAAGLVMGDIPVMKLVWDQPLFWNYIGAFAYFLLPIPMFMLLAEWLSKSNFEVSHFTWLWKFHLTFLVIAAVSSLLNIVNVTQLYPIFDGVFTTSVLILVVSVLFIFHKVTTEQKVLILAYFGFCGVMMLDMAVAHSWLSWSSVPVSSGALIFSLAIIGLSFNHYLLTQRQLEELNLLLETKVEERTEQLGVMAEKERLRSDYLQFHQGKLEKISDIILALESCHSLETGVEKVGDYIADLCQPFSGIYRIAKPEGWEIIQSWGDHYSIPVVDDAMIKHTRIWNEGGFFSLNVADPQGIVHCVAILQVQVKELPEGYATDEFLPLLHRAVDKISIVLANIALREELQRFSYEDDLTGLKNRRFLEDVLEHEVAIAQRNSQPLSLLMCDIDHFKKFNDSYGHPAGDEALKAIAGLLHKSFRQADIACRLGGEEFVVLMPMAEAEECLRRAEQLIEAVAKSEITYDGMALGGVTLSVGIASYPMHTKDPGKLLHLADLALYDAKESGRSCIRLAKPE